MAQSAKVSFHASDHIDMEITQGASAPARTFHAGGAMATRSTAAGLSDQRAAEIRQRIRERAYDAPEVIEEVTRRILDHGDV